MYVQMVDQVSQRFWFPGLLRQTIEAKLCVKTKLRRTTATTSAPPRKGKQYATTSKCPRSMKNSGTILRSYKPDEKIIRRRSYLNRKVIRAHTALAPQWCNDLRLRDGTPLSQNGHHQRMATEITFPSQHTPRAAENTPFR